MLNGTRGMPKTRDRVMRRGFFFGRTRGSNAGLPRRWQSKYAVARPASARYSRTSGPPIDAASIRRPEQTDFTRERGRRS